MTQTGHPDQPIRPRYGRHSRKPWLVRIAADIARPPSGHLGSSWVQSFSPQSPSTLAALQNDPGLCTLCAMRNSVSSSVSTAGARSGESGLEGIETAMASLWARADEHDDFIEADLAFHRAIFAASGNDLLLYIYDVISVEQPRGIGAL